MGTVLDFDRLNKIGFDKFAEEYFSIMEISETQKKDRVRVSKEIREIVILLFTYIEEAQSREMLDKDFALRLFRQRVLPVVEQEVRPKNASEKEYVNRYVARMTDDILFVTLINTGAYWLSTDRASLIGLNEANTIRNYGDLLVAIAKGFTRKQWLTMKDDRVRPTHNAVDDVIKPINGWFEVGNDLMLYPHDYINGSPDETINCRCSLLYL